MTSGEEKKLSKLAHRVLNYHVRDELMRARNKFPQCNSLHEGYAILLEEVDELWAEIKTNQPERALAEAVQVAAMAVSLVLKIEADMKAKSAK